MKRKQLNLAECWEGSIKKKAPSYNGVQPITDENDSENEPSELCQLTMTEEGMPKEPLLFKMRKVAVKVSAVVMEV